MATYFISDLHLEMERPAITQGFLRLLHSLNDADALYILGDFFEVWVGDDHTSPLIERVKQALFTLSQRGVTTYLMHGNRDFMIGDAFCQEAGIQLLSDPSVISLDQERVLLMHGDSLCTQDLDYMKVRALLRSVPFQQTMMQQSIEQRLAFAEKARKESQASQAGKQMEIMDVTPEEVDRVMDEANVHTMIHGHTHRPKQHQWVWQEQSRQRWVLGDWNDEHGWLIRWDSSTGLELRQFHFDELPTLN
ncbi:MAG: UDP-2,3-diacylglucosamine diphosphatase [Bacterioplanes sp.]|nr:UDP-2,3-diacylglucosamine diphosphatase [Bacterioplanes sp.]